mmetsp:Transcript_5336/g.14436  ORF Transcript_5336/g.14436 Transcript_5336/m.14436 type:complete len:202 (+) Transcript_5336:282-887(+)
MAATVHRACSDHDGIPTATEMMGRDADVDCSIDGWRERIRAQQIVPSADPNGVGGATNGEMTKKRNVFLKCWDGKLLCCTLECETADADEIMGVLRQQVTKNYPYITMEDVYFSAKGKMLTVGDPAGTTHGEEDRCLSIFDDDGVTVFVHRRLRGGCFMVSCSVLGLILFFVVISPCTCGLSMVAVPLLLPLLFILPLCCL